MRKKVALSRLKFVEPIESPEQREARWTEFRQSLGHCPDCQNRLSFEYERDYLTNTIREVAQCPSCRTQVREHDGFVH